MAAVENAIGDVCSTIKNWAYPLASGDSYATIWAQTVTLKLYERFPGYHAVAVHTSHDFFPEGAKNVEWAHIHFELEYATGSRGFEVWIFQTGKYVQSGDKGKHNLGIAGRPAPNWDGNKVIFSADPDVQPKPLNELV